MGSEPHAALRAHVLDQPLERRHARPPPRHERVQRQQEHRALLVRPIELGPIDLEHLVIADAVIRARRPVVAVVGVIVQAPVNRQLHDPRRIPIGQDLVRAVVPHQARIVQQVTVADDRQSLRGEIPRRRTNPHRLPSQPPRPPLDGALRQHPLLARLQLRQRLVRPAVQRDLVLHRRIQDRVHRLGMQLPAHCRNEECGRNPIPLQQIQNPRNPDPGAILAPRQRLRRRLPRPQEARLGVHIEGKRHRHSRPSRPLLRRQIPPRADLVHGRLDLRQILPPKRVLGKRRRRAEHQNQPPHPPSISQTREPAGADRVSWKDSILTASRRKRPEIPYCCIE